MFGGHKSEALQTPQQSPTNPPVIFQYFLRKSTWEMQNGTHRTISIHQAQEIENTIPFYLELLINKKEKQKSW